MTMPMERCWSLDEVVRDPLAVVTVGTFDGVHRGHQAVLAYLVERARHHGGHSVVVTFDPHPRTVVHGEPVPLLTTPGERAEVCARSGVDRFIVLPFDEALAAMTPDGFVRDILSERIGLTAMVVGHDHAFGRDRSGRHEQLEALATELGFRLDTIPPASVGDAVVSSSAIRRILLRDGDVRKASDLLGHRYRLSGHVVAGARRGRTLGYPTANLVPEDARKLVPTEGVYAVSVRDERRARAWPGMLNIGRRPTFEESEVRIEAHLLDFSGDLYDRRLTVDFIEHLRPERRFPTIEALIAQLREDEARCRSILKDVSL
jgi:riboflavin kinase/FMN adenylyltransferase